MTKPTISWDKAVDDSAQVITYMMAHRNEFGWRVTVGNTRCHRTNAERCALFGDACTQAAIALSAAMEAK